MPVITFMSDFGAADQYVAAVKGKLLFNDPSQQIVDISHIIKPYDISQAAVVLSSVFRDFASGTIHLVAVDSLRNQSKGIAIELEGHFFIGFDCGLLSMISKEKPTNLVSIDTSSSTFPVKDQLAEVVIQLSRGAKLKDLGEEIDVMETLFARQLKVTRREISGNVVHVDHYGNLITNITKVEFDKILQLNGENVEYTIRFGRESFNSFHTYFTDVDSGDCYLFFNSIGYLQIGINKGNATQLLGLNIDAPVHIEFQQ